MDLKALLGDAYKEGMTFAEIQTALEKVALPTDESASQELAKVKKALEKSNSEAADYKRKYQEKLTADERAAAEREAADKAIQEELASLRRDKAISESKAKFLGMGYADDLADDSAKAIADGDYERFYQNQAKHIQAVEARVKAEVLSATPTPPPGNGGSTITKEAFAKMGYEERVKLSEENPALYKQLTSD